MFTDIGMQLVDQLVASVRVYVLWPYVLQLFWKYEA